MLNSKCFSKKAIKFTKANYIRSAPHGKQFISGKLVTQLVQTHERCHPHQRDQMKKYSILFHIITER